MLGTAQKMFLSMHSNLHSDRDVDACIPSGRELDRWPLLDRLLAQNRLAYIDYALSEKLLGNASSNESAAALICHLSLAVRLGHVCISVDEQEVYPDPLVIWKESAEDTDIDPISLNEELLKIKKLIIQGASALPSEITAINKEGSYFYFQRYWHYEKQLIKHLKLLTTVNPKLIPNMELVRQSTQNLLAQGKLLEEQSKAIVNACESGLSIISGGPGTGKTYSAGILIKTFWESLDETQREKCEIALAAPTGKAASNLQASLLKAAADFAPLQKIKAKTLHALLGLRGGKPPRELQVLSADLIVIDESSMIDVRIMSYLFAAIKPGARVILLGDPHQLPAVEAGSVFADIIKAASAVGLSIVTELQKCLRTELKDIIDFARLVNSGSSEEALDRLNKDGYIGVKRLEVGSPNAHPSIVQNNLIEIACRHYRIESGDVKDPEKLIQHYNKFRILSPLRRGSFGFEEFNRRVFKHMWEYTAKEAEFIAPIMLVSNDSRMELFNGEVGVLVRQNISRTNEMSMNYGDYALFPSKDGSHGLRKIPALLLPSFEYAYCMSVHKSQGSEFGHVLLLMPPGAEVFGREVLYTAVTRAKQKLEIWGPDEVLEATIKKKSHRLSGIHL